jgi:phosphatidate cytidylyltransferase
VSLPSLPDSPLTLPVALVFGVLVLASLVVLALRLTKPGLAALPEFSARIRSWWVIASVFLAAVLLAGRVALVFWAFVCFWALKEFFSLVPGRFVDRVAIFAAYLAIPFQFLWIDVRWYGMFIIFIPVYLFLLVPFLLMATGEVKGYVVSASRIHSGLMTFVFGLSHAAALLARPPLAGFRAGPRGLLRFLTPLDLPHALGAGALISVFGFVGDVVVSAVKRDVGVKDSSHAIPGHGGVPDRIDSLCYTAPLFFHYVRYVSY